METPTNIDRFASAIKNNKFNMHEELSFLEIILTKYKLISKSQYARQNNITPQGVESRLKSNNDPFIYIADKLYFVMCFFNCIITFRI